MNFKPLLISFALVSLLLLAACAAQISEETLSRVDRDTTLSMVHESPDSAIGKQLLLGGSIVSIDSDERSTVLEILEWHLNSYGEPLYVDDAGLKFLVATDQALDHINEAGMLVTMAGVVTGKETRLKDGVEYTYPTFELLEIHLWDTPLRYGTHRNQDPNYPHYPGATDNEMRNPYDPGYRDYPYSPYWLRRITQ
jgi:outer membrane lipoprotein